MHIDFQNLSFGTEGDVETRFLVPFLREELYLNIPADKLYSKESLPSMPIDKGAKATRYVPDFSIWMNAFPVMMIEAKVPGASAEQGYKEACLYAQQRNSGYPTKINPARFILACNGDRLLAGYWDSKPEVDVLLKDLIPGGVQLERIIAGFGRSALEAFAKECLSKIDRSEAERAFSRVGGQALLNSRKQLNSFAAELSPVLTRYFSSTESDIREIAEHAYVSSNEITEYDKVLEALLKDRTALRRDTIVEQLEVSRSRESHIERVIAGFAANKRREGHLQIVQGSVGAGKSLFIRRFQQVLQSDDLREKTRWAWIDFNAGPADLGDARDWLCESFVSSFELENPHIDMSASETMKGIFSRQIQRRKPIYDDVAKGNPEAAARMRGEDLVKWQDSALETARGIGNLIMGIRQNEVLIVVLDNVDRLDLNSQLQAFQLSLWFLKEMKCFVILQMRDETYERYKSQKPLDTYRTGIAFHISPPRFIDVVRRRLDLSVIYLSQVAHDTQSYTLPSGMRITVPTTKLGGFLAELYSEIFEKRRNVSRVLESLAGNDVRRALDMFISIVTSGHLGEDQITSQVQGAGEFRISESNILKILMRGQYRYYNENSSFVTNIFQSDRGWRRFSNFLYGEILYFLSSKRKESGQIGIEGYFSIRQIANELIVYGYDPDDVLSASKTLLQKYLLTADHMNNVDLNWDDCVKVNASGYIHLRTLSERIEYVYGILPSTRIYNSDTVDVIVDVVKRENTVGDVSPSAKAIAVRRFQEYLLRQATENAALSGRIFNLHEQSSGTAYLVRQVIGCVKRFFDRIEPGQNLLD